MIIFKKLIGVVSLLMIVSCATDGIGRYRVQSIGNAQRSIEATVLRSAPVYIQEESSGSGAALGGTVGGGLAADGSDNVAVIIAGIIAGAIVGGYVEGINNIHQATEYVIQTSNGALFTVAQIDSNNEIFVEGDNVILVYGYPARLLKDTRN
jgi:outer membrane lipoprotein SlyB